MKLIIDIPEEVYRASRIIDVKSEDVIQIPLEVLANGTPLDSVKIEIKAMFPPSGDWMYDEECVHEHTVCEVLVDVLQILDNIGKAESEDKSCNTCKNNDDEFSGECYECVKNIQNHYKAESEDI